MMIAICAMASTRAKRYRRFQTAANAPTEMIARHNLKWNGPPFLRQPVPNQRRAAFGENETHQRQQRHRESRRERASPKILRNSVSSVSFVR